MADHGCYREEVQSAVSRWGSYSAMAGAPARLFFFESQSEGPAHHFLDACFLCRMPLGRNRDIFMYRGDTPFCSEECRQEQIEMDEAREKSIAMSMKAASSRKEQKKQADQAAAAAAQGIEVRAAGAVLAV